jgi:hypothetical protein
MYVRLTNDHKDRPRIYETSASLIFTMDKDAIYVESVELDRGWAALEWDIIQQMTAPSPTSEGITE